MRDLHIAVVGAGIGGLAAALGLQRAGFRVSVHEQAPELGEVGAGLSLGPTAAHALRWLGLGPALDLHAYLPENQAVRHYQDGHALQWINRGRSLLQKYGERYYLIHRADVHDALAAAVRANDPDAIRLGRRCTGLEQTANSATVRFEDGTHVTADVVIGADGSRSIVRRLLFGDSGPTYTGYIAWRGLVPMERVPQSVLDPPSGIYIGPGHLVNRYPVRRWQLLNFIAFAERAEWSEEGWSIPSTVDELMAEFEDWHPDVRTFLAAVPPELLFKWGLFDREPLTTWHSGRTTLLGDAAHPVLPFLGHGAVLAIEDAVLLARAFAGSAEIGEALQRYEAARIPRAAFVVRESRQAVKVYHSHEPEKYAQKTGGQAADERLGLFDYNPSTISV
ncbi:MAG TPA: FAD-dependent monooxygenase [Steroidobacteraceae bacterium]|nr:FAD-dependent monooxygenase [Steroidobacteraceae bacterium]